MSATTIKLGLYTTLRLYNSGAAHLVETGLNGFPDAQVFLMPHEVKKLRAFLNAVAEGTE